jgi:nicotinate phosphoribosyltransferase
MKGEVSGLEQVKRLHQISAFQVDEDRLMFSATGEEIDAGLTSDLYFVRTNEILEELNLDGTQVVAEIFPRRSGYLCGMEECIRLLRGKGVKRRCWGSWPAPQAGQLMPGNAWKRPGANP